MWSGSGVGLVAWYWNRLGRDERCLRHRETTLLYPSQMVPWGETPMSFSGGGIPQETKHSLGPPSRRRLQPDRKLNTLGRAHDVG